VGREARRRPCLAVAAVTCPEFKPIGEVLNGLEITELPEGSIPMEGIFIIKAMDEEGCTTYGWHMTHGINDIEAVGAMEYVLHKIKVYWDEEDRVEGDEEDH